MNKATCLEGDPVARLPPLYIMLILFKVLLHRVLQPVGKDGLALHLLLPLPLHLHDRSRLSK